MAEPMIEKHSLSYDNLFAGSQAKIVTDKVTLKAGRAYLRGSILALITAENKAVLVDSTKTDGSQVPFAVLADDVDATLSDKTAAVYLTGEFNDSKLTFGGTDTLAKHKTELRRIGIFTRKTSK
ncbi:MULTISPECIES: head decoration protein [Paenibacillus]|uniref:head decoration protein n=1 Tax=Paenibacillus TaxID=44249 RepID=UPI0022B85F7B|nr:head decoration protein [Paenibacillus caseinilyticus]MCZ8520134.1 head decoration protein [Paenibacillus caseinilyticus]